MGKEQNKPIIDQNGNEICSKRNMKSKKVKDWIVKNIWSLCGTGLGLGITIFGVINILANKMYANEFSDYYGIPNQYFESMHTIEDKIIFLFMALLLLIYPLLLGITVKFAKSKILTIILFITTVFVLFSQNLFYTVELIDKFNSNWLNKYVDSYISIIILVVVDVILAYFFIIERIYEPNIKMKWGKLKKIIFMVSFVISISDIIFGIYTVINRGIDDKKTYEIIQIDKESKVIIAQVNNQFLVMDYKANGNQILIKKEDGYSFVDTDAGIIKCITYDRVIVR